MDRVRSLLGAALALVCFSAIAGSSSPTWTWRNPLPNSDTLTTVAFGASVYVAAGQDGSIFSSPDGATWTQRSNVLGDGGFYVDAIYGGGFANDGSQLIAAGIEGVILSTGKPSSIQSPAGSACESLPAVPDLVSYNPNSADTGGSSSNKSSGGGKFDLLTLVILLGLLMMRRRGEI